MTVPPCVAGKFKAFGFHGICNPCGFGDIFIEIKVRMSIEPVFLGFIQALRIAGCIDFIRAVAEHAVVTCEGNDAVSIVVGEIRMLIDKGRKKRHDVVVSCMLLAGVIRIDAFYLSAVIDNKLFGNTLIIISVIIAEIILGHDSRMFARGQHERVILLEVYVAVGIHSLLHHIAHCYKHNTVIIHLLCDCVELVC